MGVWGTGPFDNDDAADMVAGLSEYVDKVNRGSDKPSRGKRRGLLVRDRYSAARAAAQFVVAAHGTDILGGPGLAPVVRALARMRMDSGWLAGYRQPRKIADAINKEMLVVVGRMHLCKGCRKSIKRPEWRELEALVEEAASQPVPKSTMSKRRVPRATRAAVKKLLRTKAPRSKR